MKVEYKQAFSEVDAIMCLMPTELLNKIPKEFIQIIRQEKDMAYNPNITEPFEEQKLMDETIIILGLIYRDFLTSAEEKKKLQLEDAEELRKVQEELKEKYNPENVFKNRNTNIKRTEEKKDLIKYEEKNWIKKLFDKIKKIFKKYNH